MVDCLSVNPPYELSASAVVDSVALWLFTTIRLSSETAFGLSSYLFTKTINMGDMVQN